MRGDYSAAQDEKLGEVIKEAEDTGKGVLGKDDTVVVQDRRESAILLDAKNE